VQGLVHLELHIQCCDAFGFCFWLHDDLKNIVHGAAVACGDCSARDLQVKKHRQCNSRRIASAGQLEQNNLQHVAYSKQVTEAGSD
jgi:hypothetical protein